MINWDNVLKNLKEKDKNSFNVRSGDPIDLLSDFFWSDKYYNDLDSSKKIVMEKIEEILGALSKNKIISELLNMDEEKKFLFRNFVNLILKKNNPKHIEMMVGLCFHNEDTNLKNMLYEHNEFTEVVNLIRLGNFDKIQSKKYLNEYIEAQNSFAVPYVTNEKNSITKDDIKSFVLAKNFIVENIGYIEDELFKKSYFSFFENSVADEVKKEKYNNLKSDEDYITNIKKLLTNPLDVIGEKLNLQKISGLMKLEAVKEFSALLNSTLFELNLHAIDKNQVKVFLEQQMSQFKSIGKSNLVEIIEMATKPKIEPLEIIDELMRSDRIFIKKRNKEINDAIKANNQLILDCSVQLEKIKKELLSVGFENITISSRKYKNVKLLKMSDISDYDMWYEISTKLFDILGKNSNELRDKIREMQQTNAVITKDSVLSKEKSFVDEMLKLDINIIEKYMDNPLILDKYHDDWDLFPNLNPIFKQSVKNKSEDELNKIYIYGLMTGSSFIRYEIPSENKQQVNRKLFELLASESDELGNKEGVLGEKIKNECNVEVLVNDYLESLCANKEEKKLEAFWDWFLESTIYNSKEKIKISSENYINSLSIFKKYILGYIDNQSTFKQKYFVLSLPNYMDVVMNVLEDMNINPKFNLSDKIQLLLNIEMDLSKGISIKTIDVKKIKEAKIFNKDEYNEFTYKYIELLFKQLTTSAIKLSIDTLMDLLKEETVFNDKRIPMIILELSEYGLYKEMKEIMPKNVREVFDFIKSNTKTTSEGIALLKEALLLLQMDDLNIMKPTTKRAKI